jgi:GNAT superfamily N-acetyltransferase
MVSIRRISTDDPLYQQAVALREQVLLGPVGMDIAEYRRRAPGVEERAEHFVAVLDHPTGPRVIGCAGLVVEEKAGADPGGADRAAEAPTSEQVGGTGRGKLIQMAVDPQRQGEGVGRRLLAAVEARALGELGLEGLYCHAQETAVGFYQRQGWVAEPGDFMEVGLPHRLMTLTGSPRPEPGVGRPGLDPEEPYGPQALAPQ